MSNIGGITHQSFNARPNVRVLQCNVRVLDAAPCVLCAAQPGLDTRWINYPWWRNLGHGARDYPSTGNTSQGCTIIIGKLYLVIEFPCLLTLHISMVLAAAD